MICVDNIRVIIGGGSFEIWYECDGQDRPIVGELFRTHGHEEVPGDDRITVLKLHRKVSLW